MNRGRPELGADDPKVTVDDIDSAPTRLPPQRSELTYEQQDQLLNRIGDLSDQIYDLREQNHKLKQKLGAADELNKLIAPYARKAFWFMCGYSGFVGVSILLDGFGIWGFSLENGVLEFLVGSTAVTVIGLVGMVLTGVFVGARK